MTPNREKEIRKSCADGREWDIHPSHYQDCRELLAEIDQLRGNLQVVCDQAEELTGEVIGLRESLRKYIRPMHMGYCTYNDDDSVPCSCGLAEIKAKIDDRTKDHPNPTGKPRGIRGSK